MTDTEIKRLQAICEVANVDDIEDLSDGFHTFNDLYEQRMYLFAALVKTYKDKAWKSMRHEDGEMCFGGDWFIVGIDTPTGSYTYHYGIKYWDVFDCQILKTAKHWDGHTEKDVTRLLSLPSVQPDHTADINKKISSSCSHENDTISRQVAIELKPEFLNPNVNRETEEQTAIDRAYARGWNSCNTHWIDEISELPSAQPEPSEIARDIATIIENEKDMRVVLKNSEPCEDAVSRQRLLSDLKELVAAWEKYPVMAEQIKGVETAIGYVKLIPSVPPKRNTGKWVHGKCSNCGEHAPFWAMASTYYESDFCPNCGAMMTDAETGK